MKTILTIACIITSMFFLTGCPYESSVSIDKPSVKINPALFGKWKDEKSTDIYEVSKHDEFTYSIAELNKSGDKDLLLGFISMVDGVSFLNLTEAKPDDSSKQKYSFYKMEMQPDGSVLLSEVTENIRESFTASAELKKFISANMKNSYLFGKDTLTLVRNGN
jgi:hypothetical protein